MKVIQCRLVAADLLRRDHKREVGLQVFAGSGKEIIVNVRTMASLQRPASD